MNRLVLFTSLPDVGGHTTITIGLVSLLKKEFDNIWVISREMNGHGTSRSAIQQIEDAGACVLSLRNGTAPTDFARIVTSLLGNHFRPDVFISIGMRNLSPLIALALLPKVSIYYHITHELTAGVLRQLQRYEYFINKIAFISPTTQGLYNSASVRSKLNTLSVTQPIVPIPYKVNDSSKGRAARTRFGFMGRLNAGKGCDVLGEFVQQCPYRCSLRVAGSGEYADKFIELSANPKTNVEVRFDGPFTQENRNEYLVEFFNDVDILVVPSQDDREGIPTVILEALSAGVPVVATCTGGMKAFGDSKFGNATCVRLIDKENVVSELINLAGSTPILQRDSCRAYFNSSFSNEVLLAQWLSAIGQPGT